MLNIFSWKKMSMYCHYLSVVCIIFVQKKKIIGCNSFICWQILLKLTMFPRTMFIFPETFETVTVILVNWKSSILAITFSLLTDFKNAYTYLPSYYNNYCDLGLQMTVTSNQALDYFFFFCLPTCWPTFNLF